MLLLVATAQGAGPAGVMVTGSGFYLVAELMHRHPSGSCCCPA